MKKAREQPDGATEAPKSPSRTTLRGLDCLNFLLADVRTGVGPFLAIYLAGYKWDEERVGLALTVGGIAGILTQTPAGALVDFLRSKRGLWRRRLSPFSTSSCPRRATYDWQASDKYGWRQ